MLRRVRQFIRSLLRPARHVPYAVIGELARDLPERFTCIASGRSMVPTIMPGAVLTIEKSARESARAGDIVMVHTAYGLVVHRLVDTAEGLQLRGDALNQPDGLFASFEWVGRVTEVRQEPLSHPSWARLRSRVRRHVRRRMLQLRC